MLAKTLKQRLHKDKQVLTFSNGTSTVHFNPGLFYELSVAPVALPEVMGCLKGLIVAFFQVVLSSEQSNMPTYCRWSEVGIPVCFLLIHFRSIIHHGVFNRVDQHWWNCNRRPLFKPIGHNRSLKLKAPQLFYIGWYSSSISVEPKCKARLSYCSSNVSRWNATQLCFASVCMLVLSHRKNDGKEK